MLNVFDLHQIKDGNLIFQQHGAPPHCKNVVRDFLDSNFLQRRNGRIWMEGLATILTRELLFMKILKHKK